jgi:hypothetical protein
MHRCHQKKHVDEGQRDIDEKAPEIKQRRVSHRQEMAVPTQNGRQQRRQQRQRLIELVGLGQPAVLDPRHSRQRGGKSNADRDGEKTPDQIGSGVGSGLANVFGSRVHDHASHVKVFGHSAAARRDGGVPRLHSHLFSAVALPWAAASEGPRASRRAP